MEISNETELLLKEVIKGDIPSDPENLRRTLEALLDEKTENIMQHGTNQVPEKEMYKYNKVSEAYTKFMIEYEEYVDERIESLNKQSDE